MKPVCVLVAVLAAILAMGGCKKRETKPAPQVVHVAAPVTGPAGIPVA